MARDKRTRRAEARRRRREQLRAEGASATVSAEPAADAPPKRRSLLDALGPAITLPDVGADLRSLPWIARHTPAFALPILAVGGAFFVALDPSVFELPSQPGDPASLILARALFQFLLVPPPVTAVFVAAVLTPRASWLVGGIIGLVSTSLFLLLVAIHGPSDNLAGTLTPATALQALAGFLPIYIVLGAFAGWYRRLLMGMQARTRQRAEERRKTQARAAKRARTAPARR